MAKRIKIPGSERRALTGAKVVGKVDPEQRIEITLQVRRRPGSPLEQQVAAIASQKLGERKYLTREELANQSGADPADIAKVGSFAHDHGLTVTEASVPRRTVKLSGTIKDMSKAFGVKLQRYKAGAVSYRGRTGTITVPDEMDGVIERVLGLDDRPTLRPHYRRLRVANRKGKAVKGKAKPRDAAAAQGTFTALQLADIYNFPPGLDGTGQTVAIIELNDVDNNGNPTGTGYSTSDLQTYFDDLNIPMPNVTAVGVDGGANVPGPDMNADGEVTLDIEVAAAVAPKANFAVYFGTNTDDGFIQAVSAAVHDDIRKPSVVSISWGQAEETATQQLLDGLDQVLQEASALGVTVCVAAGDNGSPDMLQNVWDGQPHVDFPASNPFSLACGGTTLDPSSTHGAPSETVWNEGAQGGSTGGGVSNVFPKPPYQANTNVPPPANAAGGRGVPDVAADADPNTGYMVVLGGQQQTFGGTSAVAPLYAGLLARINQSLTSNGKAPVGFVNPLLYAQSMPANAFHDVTAGNNDIYGQLNGMFPAGPGWDPCTGLGSIDGANLMAALPNAQPVAAPPPAAKAAAKIAGKR